MKTGFVVFKVWVTARFKTSFMECLSVVYFCTQDSFADKLYVHVLTTGPDQVQISGHYSDSSTSTVTITQQKMTNLFSFIYIYMYRERYAFI